MPKLKLVADPTFKATVQIPVAGAGTVPVLFTFRHRSKDQVNEFFKADQASRDEVDLVMDIASGWDLDDPWDRDNVQKLLQVYYGAGAAISKAYVIELTGARKGN